MSFTEDELQSFNTILEQRLQAQQREMERALDQRMNEYHRELDQRLAALHADIQRGVSQKLSDFQVRVETMLSEKLNTQPAQLMQALNREIEQRQQQFEGNIDRMLAAQLLGIEQLISHYTFLSEPESDNSAISADTSDQCDTIEVQTELSWENLMDIIGKALDGRLSVLNDSVERSLKNLEHYLSVRIHSLNDEFLRYRNQGRGHESIFEGDPTNFKEILQGIEHLDQVVESMQVVMTSNHALLSNRIYHHQQLPFERAHHTNDLSRQISNGMNKQDAISEEHMINGVDPEGISEQSQLEEL
ncbi:MAG: hypothetical protein ACXWPG_02665 [Ktedonobacteraceae bacterium]